MSSVFKGSDTVQPLNAAAHTGTLITLSPFKSSTSQVFSFTAVIRAIDAVFTIFSIPCLIAVFIISSLVAASNQSKLE